jgi:hypothetical protein
MIKRSNVGKTIKIKGTEYIVLSFDSYPFSDLGCGPVFEVCTATLQDKESGDIEIKWDD